MTRRLRSKRREITYPPYRVIDEFRNSRGRWLCDEKGRVDFLEVLIAVGVLGIPTSIVLIAVGELIAWWAA